MKVGANEIPAQHTTGQSRNLLKLIHRASVSRRPVRLHGIMGRLTVGHHASVLVATVNEWL
ncbi:hypothetical protein ACIOG7_27010 [Streptomyces sp. NPDC087894]|uniref:hypothetical protein n=1 Tax=Streptomyces sp. NPDC087894 TaxID=3365816 RepID=UPI0037FEBB55